MSPARNFSVVGARGGVDRLTLCASAYLQKPRGVHVPVVGGLGQSAAELHSFVQIIII